MLSQWQKINTVLFSEIEDAVLMGKFDLGVIIHENRFTYHQKGLIKICDLGEVWEERQKAPIPLACIAARNSLDIQLRNKVSNFIKKSVEYAFVIIRKLLPTPKNMHRLWMKM